jgi:hypothetical protein
MVILLRTFTGNAKQYYLRTLSFQTMPNNEKSSLGLHRQIEYYCLSKPSQASKTYMKKTLTSFAKLL